jgi:hypothetical protein
LGADQKIAAYCILSLDDSATVNKTNQARFPDAKGIQVDSLSVGALTTQRHKIRINNGDGTASIAQHRL